MPDKTSNSTADLTASGLPTKSSNTCPHGHEWVVFSTALAEVCLMVQCVECGTMGSIDDPSTEEWSEAFDAPSSPYRWIDGARVRERGIASPRVIRDACRSALPVPAPHRARTDQRLRRVSPAA